MVEHTMVTIPEPEVVQLMVFHMVDQDQDQLITEQDLDQLMLAHLQDSIHVYSLPHHMAAFSTETILGNHQCLKLMVLMDQTSSAQFITEDPCQGQLMQDLIIHLTTEEYITVTMVEPILETIL